MIEAAPCAPVFAPADTVDVAAADVADAAPAERNGNRNSMNLFHSASSGLMPAPKARKRAERLRSHHEAASDEADDASDLR